MFINKKFFFLICFLILLIDFDNLRFKAIIFGLSPNTLREPPKRTKLSNLGELLFYDPILSGEMDVSCATCHHPKFGFGDGRERSIGVGGTGLGPNRTFRAKAHDRVFGRLEQSARNSSTIMNLNLLPDIYLQELKSGLFWDGRVKNLREQLTAPLRSRDEMRGDAFAPMDAVGEILKRLSLNDRYLQLFREAFKQPTLGKITVEHLETALEAFEKILITPATPYDRYLMGEDPPSKSFERGFKLFFDLQCAECHNGVLLSDMKFYRTGAPMGPFGRSFHGVCDIGREEVTSDPRTRMEFRTPSLRELKHTAPYTHAGKLKTLKDVIKFFVSDENFVRQECLDYFSEPPSWKRSLKRNLTEGELEDLVEFLGSLSTPGSIESLFPPPITVPSGLPIDH